MPCSSAAHDATTSASGQDRLAKDIGSIDSFNGFIEELEACGPIDITRRGQEEMNIYTINFIIKRKPSILIPTH